MILLFVFYFKFIILLLLDKYILFQNTNMTPISRIMSVITLVVLVIMMTMVADGEAYGGQCASDNDCEREEICLSGACRLLEPVDF